MRSLFNRLALVGIVGVALAGCGTQSGSSLPVGGALNSGGGTTIVGPQSPTAGTIPGLLIDGGTKPYTGFNVTATDTLTPTAAQATDASGKTAPADVAGTHSIAYAGNGLTQQIFTFSGNPVNLTIPAGSGAGDSFITNYGAIVFFATPPAGATLSIELAGGAGGTTYDVRIACTGTAVTGRPQSTRYLCPLPAYGTASSTNIVNPVVASNATGAFTPTAARLYIVSNTAAPLATTTANTLLLDYLYAEQTSA